MNLETSLSLGNLHICEGKLIKLPGSNTMSFEAITEFDDQVGIYIAKFIPKKILLPGVRPLNGAWNID